MNEVRGKKQKKSDAVEVEVRVGMRSDGEWSDHVLLKESQ